MVFGDHGHLQYIAGATDVTLLHLVESIDFEHGGADAITTAGGDDIVFGGGGGDTIDSGAGASIVFGDHGRVTGIEGAGANRPIDTRTPVDDFQVATLARVETLNPAAGEFGGADIIHTGVGRDIVFGGAAGDTIVANLGETVALPDGNNVVFGDYGFLDYVAAPATSPLSLDRVWSSDEPFGGDDTITTGTRNDFIFGGSGSDVIDAGKGQNVVFGDHGRITGTQTATLNRSVAGLSVDDDYPIDVLALVEGYAPAGESGGVDTITTGIGADVVFGGAAGDTIVANAGETTTPVDGNNVVFGDYGLLDYTSSGFDPSPVSLDRVWSSFESLGGADTITTGTRNDFVFGGVGNDVIDAGKGQNVVFGDHGRITGIESAAFNQPIRDTLARDDYPIDVLALVEAYVPAGGEFGGDDTIATGIGRDMVFGGAGDDTIVATTARRPRHRTTTTSSSATTASSTTAATTTIRTTSTACGRWIRRSPSVATTRSRPASAATTSSSAAPATTRSARARTATSSSATTPG